MKRHTVCCRILLYSCSCVHSARLNIVAIAIVDWSSALIGVQPRLRLDNDNFLEMVRANTSCP